MFKKISDWFTLFFIVFIALILLQQFCYCQKKERKLCILKKCRNRAPLPRKNLSIS